MMKNRPTSNRVNEKQNRQQNSMSALERFIVIIVEIILLGQYPNVNT